MSLLIAPPNPGNTAWTEFSEVVIETTRHGTLAARWVDAANGYRYAVARSKINDKWWIVDDHEILPRHGPFDTPELAWSTLRLLA
jgi:hypothetical protein